MQSLDITDEQHAFIQRLRAELSDQVVGKYGYVRDQDAVQFLIDNLDGDLDVEPEVAFTTAAELADESSESGLEEITYEESETVETDADPANEGAPNTDNDDADDSGVDEGEEETDGDAADREEEDDGSEDEAASGDDDSSNGAADDDDMLNQMMNLLDTHEDKWEESSSADYRYSVTLPDGSVEHVQTKDDVRALLFKNY